MCCMQRVQSLKLKPLLIAMMQAALHFGKPRLQGFTHALRNETPRGL